MDKIKIIFKERLCGLFLLFLAGIIITGISLGSYPAESKNDPVFTDHSQSLSQKEKVLGEENSVLEDAILDEEEKKEEEIDSQDAQEEEVSGNNDPVFDSEDVFYEELKTHLKKYCGKNFNVKKCRDYLLEAKDARAKGSRFKDLYKKYHFEKKKVTISDNTISSVATENIKTTLVIKFNGNSKSYEIESAKSISVLDLMRQGNISYDILNDGRIDNVGGEKKESGNFSWMLYTCKSDECNLSKVGPSDCKIENWDKIEWRYLDLMTVPNEDWSKAW